MSKPFSTSTQGLLIDSRLDTLEAKVPDGLTPSYVQSKLDIGNTYVDLGQSSYTITANTLDTSQFYGFAKNARLLSVAPGDSLVRDRSRTIIGLSYNHKLTISYTGTFPSLVPATAITSGNLQSPPLSIAQASGPVDIAAHWYGDWGLDWYRRQTGVGSQPFYSWYDGAWNWPTNVGTTAEHGPYDPQRRSVLGAYRNDDPIALDWQCFWLREAGVKAVIPVAFNLDLSTWTAAADRNLWLYRLFNAPNFAGLSYIPWARSTDFTDPDGPVTATTGQITTQWQSLWNTLAPAYQNNYALNYGGKRWFTVYVWNMELLRQRFDTGGASTVTAAFLAARAAEVVALGYGGLAVLAHTAVSDGTMSRSALLANNVLHMPASYGGPTHSSTGGVTTYAGIVDNYAPPTSGAVLNVSTSLQTAPPIPAAPGAFSFPGSAPFQFKRLLSKALAWCSSHQNLPQLVTVYNVSEWAEGGPGLHPNVQDGWGYLDAVRQAASSVPVIGGAVKLPIPLSNSWVAGSAGNEPPSCWKDASGTVHVSGIITSGTTAGNTIVGVLPAGFRPAATESFAVAVSGGTAGIYIDVAGQIRALTALNSTSTSLSGISFLGA